MNLMVAKFINNLTKFRKTHNKIYLINEITVLIKTDRKTRFYQVLLYR